MSPLGHNMDTHILCGRNRTSRLLIWNFLALCWSPTSQFPGEILLRCLLKANLGNPQEDPNVNYRCEVILMSHCRFISFNKRTALVGNVDDGEGYG